MNDFHWKWSRTPNVFPSNFIFNFFSPFSQTNITSWCIWFHRKENKYAKLLARELLCRLIALNVVKYMVKLFACLNKSLKLHSFDIFCSGFYGEFIHFYTNTIFTRTSISYLLLATSFHRKQSFQLVNDKIYFFAWLSLALPLIHIKLFIWLPKQNCIVSLCKFNYLRNLYSSGIGILFTKIILFPEAFIEKPFGSSKNIEKSMCNNNKSWHVSITKGLNWSVEHRKI